MIWSRPSILSSILDGDANDATLQSEFADLPAQNFQQRKRAAQPVDADYGRSESLDPDNVGDIADEGAGHRG